MQNRVHRILTALVATACLLLASGTSLAASRDSQDTWDAYATLLERYLTEEDLPGGGLASAFDYQAALDDPQTGELLARQSRILAEFNTGTLDNREEAIAFWLNAYNYSMIAYLLQNPEDGKIVDSVRDYGSLFRPYRVFSLDVFNIGGSNYSLDDMEKGILLGEEYRQKGWREARVHFAVNCASVGCPPLRAQPYTPGNVDELLTENTRRAFNTHRHLHVDGDTLYLSRLFDWYEDHFRDEAGSVREFIEKYAEQSVREKIRDTDRIDYIDYDWSLNTPENFPELRKR